VQSNPTNETSPKSGASGQKLIAIVLLIFVIGYCTRMTISQQGSPMLDAFWLVCHDDANDADRKKAFLLLLDNDHREWLGPKLDGLDLHGLDFSSKYLHWIKLDEANVAGADFSNAVLTRSSLVTVQFQNADFSNADLSNAKLLRSVLTNAMFTDAVMTSASLEQVVAVDANFSGANLAETHLLMADFSGANLENADLSFCNAEAAIFTNTNLLGANFDGAFLFDADFTNCNWWRAKGISPELITDMMIEYAPTEDADSELKDDYQKWLESSDTAFNPQDLLDPIKTY